jgi:hypothetical protein
MDEPIIEVRCGLGHSIHVCCTKRLEEELDFMPNPWLWRSTRRCLLQEEVEPIDSCELIGQHI